MIYEQTHWGQAVEQVDVLLVTVNDAETSALTVALQEVGFRSRTVFYANNTYQIYTGVAGSVVAAVRSGMSSRGMSGSTLTVQEAIDDLRPAYVIGVGVAFGMKESQPIGQVLISRQLADYELQRVGTVGRRLQVIERGSRVDAHPRILGRFLAASLAEHGFDVQFGQVVSGDKLVDNLDFREALAKRFPEAIGGEMEGAGIQAAADREGTQWLVVKAVCDYAFGKSSDKIKRQAVAADSAARAVVHVISQGGLRKGL
ncbi:5'-methylthioadenosine/S-adenosylhomocysteine nucleosidase family protein [Kribbella pratensis]|nr:5'-methylthioadenosine/S-adenosylhomocysteine nucleosidase [Kribbella pratensis]